MFVCARMGGEEGSADFVPREFGSSRAKFIPCIMFSALGEPNLTCLKPGFFFRAGVFS